MQKCLNMVHGRKSSSDYNLLSTNNFCSIYSKFWKFLEQGSGFTGAKICADIGKTKVHIHDMVGYFLGHPVNL